MSSTSSFNVPSRLASKDTDLCFLVHWEAAKERYWMATAGTSVAHWTIKELLRPFYLFNESGVALLVGMSSRQHYLLLRGASDCCTRVNCNIPVLFCIPPDLSSSVSACSFADAGQQRDTDLLQFSSSSLYSVGVIPVVKSLCFPSLALSAGLSVTSGLTSRSLKDSSAH